MSFGVGVKNSIKTKAVNDHRSPDGPPSAVFLSNVSTRDWSNVRFVCKCLRVDLRWQASLSLDEQVVESCCTDFTEYSTWNPPLQQSWRSYRTHKAGNGKQVVFFQTHLQRA